ncbi:hypothetical protein D3C78_936360 [compost metagenome]
MLDGVVLNGDTLFSSMIFKTTQPVTAATEVVEVSLLELALKLFITREATVRRQQHEAGLHTFQIAVFLQGARETCECLVQRVCRDGTDCSAKYIAFHQAYDLAQLVGTQGVCLVVMISIQQERV